MRFLRRIASADPTNPEEEVVEVDPGLLDGPKGHTAGKGKPTPKRREAEGRRRGPVPPPPRTQREALRRMRGNQASKEERRKAAQFRRERMMAGDDKYLLPRDRGPVRAYARDLVDSRRNLMGLFMPLAIVVFIAVLTPNLVVQQYASLACMFMLLAMLIEGVMLGRLVSRRARQKFPDENFKGFALGWYAFTRATQLRKLRVPKPRVGYNDRVA
ncbi:DUF3043 domain-containing protein [Allokutzneria albata]|uniref:DUF3043 domain-containing protein n=1 Tax=Allokutzneria albata TaxID=211114 RepID=UPI0004C2E500|nr:DUF3043 domain-containing protein [Allokutzneria albata]